MLQNSYYTFCRYYWNILVKNGQIIAANNVKDKFLKKLRSKNITVYHIMHTQRKKEKIKKTI